MLSDTGADNHGIVRQVQEEQYGRIALQCQARPFAETVNCKIKIARLRASAVTALTFSGGPIYPLFKLPKTNDKSTGLNAHAHLIPIVSAIKHQAVDT